MFLVCSAPSVYTILNAIFIDPIVKVWGAYNKPIYSFFSIGFLFIIYISIILLLPIINSSQDITNNGNYNIKNNLAMFIFCTSFSISNNGNWYNITNNANSSIKFFDAIKITLVL